MAKKTSRNGVENTPTELIKAKAKFEQEIQDRIRKGEEILLREVDSRTSYSDFSNWHDYNLELLRQSFNKPDNEYYESYNDAGVFRGARVSVIGGSGPTLQEVQAKFKSKFQAKLDNLKKLEQKIDLLRAPIDEVPGAISSVVVHSDEVFIVHGHDALAKTEVARFISRLGFKPIILHEQASSGKTIIEKIEEYSNVGFGIVLYTPCDVGAAKGKENNLRDRARQNVVFEHGYLIGKIGRKNVCALVKGDIETPNDISGVVYVPMEGGWEIAVAKELRSSGYSVNMNLII